MTAGNSIYHERSVACAICATGFTATHPREKYCSVPCSNAGQRKRAREKRAANPDMFRARAKAYYARNPDQAKAAARAYGKTERGRELQRVRSAKRRVSEKDRVDARTKLNNALRYGRIVRGPCRDCGATETHGHHPDYSKPFDVIWLCIAHHVAEHKRIENGY